MTVARSTQKKSKGRATARAKSSLKISKVAVIYRPHKPEALKLAQDLVEWLGIAGVKVFSRIGQNGLKGTKKLASERVIADLDLIVVVGGDGTYLKAVQLLNGCPVPILGVNLGYLGFLTETRVDELYQALELALKGRLKVHTRAMLEVTVQGKARKPQRYLALNDIVIERGQVSQLINMAVLSYGHLISDIKADGLILSTPTGSTAYNLAAGGPILHPEVHAVVVTPICPHSLTNRPITLPDNHVITVRINEAYQKAVFMVDGQRREDINVKDVITVRKSDNRHLMLSLPYHNYLDLLRAKLKFGQRD